MLTPDDTTRYESNAREKLGAECASWLATDVAPIHDRQMVVLERSDWSGWLHDMGNEPELLRPLPEGSLAVEQVR